MDDDSIPAQKFTSSALRRKQSKLNETSGVFFPKKSLESQDKEESKRRSDLRVRF